MKVEVVGVAINPETSPRCVHCNTLEVDHQFITVSGNTLYNSRRVNQSRETDLRSMKILGIWGASLPTV